MGQSKKKQIKRFFWLKLIAFVGITLVGLIYGGMFYLCTIHLFVYGAFWGLD